MEVLTCFCNTDLCNDNNFNRGKFSEWTAATMARLKSGPTHIMDIAVTVATAAVALFFLAVVVSNIPWKSILGSGSSKEREMEEVNGEQEEDDEEEKEEKDEDKREKKD